MKISFIIILICIQLCARAQITGRVVGVHDGDTFTMLLEGNETVIIRLHGIDCAELNQPYGKTAKAYTSHYMFGKTVNVKIGGKDRYGRTIGVAYMPDGRILNEMLLKDGLAWHYLKYDHNPVWQQYENDAKKRGVGVWQDKTAIAPWDYRHSHKHLMK